MCNCKPSRPQAQEQMVAEAVTLSARFGKALGVSPANVLWGLGQVQARKVIIDNKVAMLLSELPSLLPKAAA